jgi:hypothetical protein
MLVQRMFYAVRILLTLFKSNKDLEDRNDSGGVGSGGSICLSTVPGVTPHVSQTFSLRS